MDLTRAVLAIRTRIASAGGDPDAVLIVGAKPPSVDACRAAVAAGVADLGENRAQELLAKAPHLEGARWHFIGRLQTNKVRQLVAHVSLWESIDRAALVDELARRDPGARILVQINISAEEQKGGCTPAMAPRLVDHARSQGLDVIGLMGIGPDGPPEGARPAFQLLRALADDLELPERSMGMTSDLEIAVQEGSTMVRVGSGLFGPRRLADLPPD